MIDPRWELSFRAGSMRPISYIETETGVPRAVGFLSTSHIEFMRAREAGETWQITTTRGDGTVMISTVFLGIDHEWGDGPPLLYETMIFWPGQELHEYQVRYPTRDDATAGHTRAVALVDAAALGDTGAGRGR